MNGTSYGCHCTYVPIGDEIRVVSCTARHHTTGIFPKIFDENEEITEKLKNLDERLKKLEEKIK